MNTKKSIVPITQDRKINIISWGLRILAAVAFLGAGGAKLAGVPMMVGIFDQIGIGQWFRMLTGIVEVGSGVALLLPTTAGLGALLLAATMFVAILVHLFVIGGSPIPAVVLLVVTIAIVWLHRASVINMLSHFKRV